MGIRISVPALLAGNCAYPTRSRESRAPPQPDDERSQPLPTLRALDSRLPLALPCPIPTARTGFADDPLTFLESG
ncbi:hypothetical protein R70199_07480 [Paraburkholderia domus]|nr:hypothetical protein R70199_07480 [Paraburkholderia domus]